MASSDKGEPRYRRPAAASRSEGGAGLGPAIVKQMGQTHRGKVWVEGEPGKGRTSYVVLPWVRTQIRWRKRH